MIRFSGSDNSQHRLAATATRLILALSIECSLIGYPFSSSQLRRLFKSGFRPRAARKRSFSMPSIRRSMIFA